MSTTVPGVSSKISLRVVYFLNVFLTQKVEKLTEKIQKPLKNCYDLTQRVRIKTARCCETLPYPSLPVPLDIVNGEFAGFGHKDSCTAKFHLKNRMNVSCFLFILKSPLLPE